MNGTRWAALVITLLLAGRAMTLGFLPQVGSGLPGAAPDAWLMPLVGDAVIGVGALGVAALLVWGRGLAAWTAIVAWNVLGIWDALAAFLVHVSVPWPDFFMVQIFGSSMFFAASAMHLVAIWLVARAPIRDAMLGHEAPA